MDGAAVSIRLRRSTPSHNAYTIRVYDRRFTALATTRPADARRWVAATRWLHWSLHHQGRLVVGLGVQWTPTRLQLHGVPPVPATLQLCVGHRCLLFHLARADAVPEMLRRFLADPRVTFVGSGSANDRRMLWAHYGLRVARGCELRAVAGMGNASLEDMADHVLGYPGIHKPRDVAMSAWHAPRLSPDQVQYACVDAYLAFHLGLVLCPAAAGPPVLPRGPPPAQQHGPFFVHPPPAQQRDPAFGRPPPAQQRGPAFVRPPPPAQQRAPVAGRPAPPVPQRAPAAGRPAPPVQQRPPAAARQALPVQQRPPSAARQAPPVQKRAPAAARQAPPVQRAPVVAPAAPRFEWSPRAFAGGSVPAVVSAGAAITNIKLAALTESDMDSETDYDDDVGVTATNGLPVRVYASDSDDIVDSSDGFEHVRFGAFTDDEDDDCESYIGTGSLGTTDGVDSNVGDQEDEEGYNRDDQEDEEGCNGDDLEDEDGCNGDDQEDEEGCNVDDLDDEEGYDGDV